MALVGTAPQRNGRMVAKPLHLVQGIRLECFRLGYLVIGDIQPEIIPDHYSVPVAPVIELIIGNTACP